MLQFKRIAPFALAAALIASPATAHDFQAGTIHVDHPYAREMPPGAPAGGGYMTIRNDGDAADRLVSVTAERAGKVELHEMTMEGDVMKMRPLADGIPIEAGGEVELRPGGLHVMFMQVEEPFAEGDRIAATLTFEQAGDLDVEFAVEAMGGGAGHDHGDHGHGDHAGEARE